MGKCAVEVAFLHRNPSLLWVRLSQAGLLFPFLSLRLFQGNKPPTNQRINRVLALTGPWARRGLDPENTRISMAVSRQLLRRPYSISQAHKVIAG
jgi:hypothetical protein